MEAELRELVYGQLKTFLAGRSLPAFAPNDFEGDDATELDRYVTMNTLPTVPNQMICAGAIHTWDVQLNFYDLPKKGELRNLREADALRDQFPAGYNFVGASRNYTISIQPSPAVGLVEGGSRFFTPVQFRIIATS